MVYGKGVIPRHRTITRELRALGWARKASRLWDIYEYGPPCDFIVVDDRIRHDQWYLNRVAALQDDKNFFSNIGRDLREFMPEDRAFRQSSEFARFVNDGCPKQGPPFGGPLEVPLGEIAKQRDR